MSLRSEAAPDAPFGVASPLASPSATQAVLERHGFNTKKAFGQNFLVNDAVVRKIVTLAEVGESDVVLEVGPGIGTLTYALLSRARSVVAIERDALLPAVLADTLAPFAGCFSLVEADALDVLDAGLAGFGYEGAMPNKLVSNLPYAVAATVVLDAFQRMPSLDGAVVMVQREVADRMRAKPGTKAYGAYTVKLALFARAGDSFAVGPNNFMPRPHVDSTVLRLDRIEAAASSIVLQAACVMADAAFFARRKTIANSCRQFFAGRGQQAFEGVAPVTLGEAGGRVADILAQANVDPATRGETLSPQRFVALGEALLSVLGL